MTTKTDRRLSVEQIAMIEDGAHSIAPELWATYFEDVEARLRLLASVGIEYTFAFCLDSASGRDSDLSVSTTCSRAQVRRAASTRR
jgi:hypothetical protein